MLSLRLSCKAILFELKDVTPARTTLIRAVCTLLLLSAAIPQSLAADEGRTKGSVTAEEQRERLPFVRLDFQVKASCVSCIRRIVKALKAMDGVCSADVSVFKPHWAVVIFESRKTDQEKIIACVKKEKSDIAALERQELKTKPLIVIPKTELHPKP